MFCMDIDFLRTFVTVVRDGSMAEAARRLALTPTAIARRMQALEAEFGTALLLRSGRTVKPTEAGARLVERAEALLREVGDLFSFVPTGSVGGVLRLGAVATTLTGLLPQALARVLAVHPRLEVHVEPGASRDLFRRVESGELDAAFIVQPQFALAKSLRFEALRREPLVLIAPRALRVLDPHRTLAEEPLIRYDRRQWGGRLADDYLRRADIRPRERLELDALDAIAVMVHHGLGVAIVPDWAAPWPADVDVQRIPLRDAKLPRVLGLLWSTGTPRQALIEALRAAAQAGPASATAGRKRRAR